MKSEANETSFRSIRLRWCLAAITGLILLPSMAVAVAHYVLPREYFAKLTMDIGSEDRWDVFGTEQRRDPDPVFRAKQLQEIQQATVLDPVIKALDLVDNWSPEGRKLEIDLAYSKLRRMLDLRETRPLPLSKLRRMFRLKEDRPSGMIEIGVYSEDAQDAANIANTVAVVYREMRRSQADRYYDGQLDQLRAHVERLRTFALELGAEAGTIRERYGIIDPDPLNAGSLGKDEPNVLELEKRIASFQHSEFKEHGRIHEYATATTRYLQATRAFRAADARLTTELLQPYCGSNPVRIWEIACPAREPAPLSLRRLWRRIVQ